MCLWWPAHSTPGVPWVVKAMQGFFGKCLFADKRKKPKWGKIWGEKKSGLQMGCVAIVALLEDLAADHNAPEQRMAVNATCHE